MEPTPGTEAWHAQVTEDIIDPERPIVDPHHHLWSGWKMKIPDYLLEDLWGDTGSGHKIEKTVFIECGANYRETGPDHLKPVGETEFVADIAILNFHSINLTKKYALGLSKNRKWPPHKY